MPILKAQLNIKPKIRYKSQAIIVFISLTTPYQGGDAMASIKVHELREKSKTDLSAQLQDFNEVVRKSITQVLTVISQKQKLALREAYKTKKFLPLDLRPN
ncbi:unnamed protein product [Brassica oleracea var. botrytis]|uniref:Uncharacterized protein n=3 Tax=Brassica TaxID=3705 RepID=A0A0D3C548_BRAOL|nr:hypothetical protein HID58_063191 [Brassica napus]CAF1869209.1 unnamed protein product [Brassica napus]VDD15565.1 unnamed protein product [Brassica oleracea]